MDKLKRIAFVTDYAGIGGGETSLLNTINGFNSYSNLQSVLVVLEDGKIHIAAKADGIDCQYLWLSKIKRAWIKSLPFVSLFGIYRAYSYLKKNNIDSIVINSSERSLVYFSIASRLMGIKSFWICHGQWEWPFGLRAKILSQLLTKVVFVSEFVKGYSTFPEEMSEVLHLGIPLPKTVPIYHSKCNRIKLALIGRFQQVKRQDLLIEAVEILCQEGFDIECNFYGDTQFSTSYDRYKTDVLKQIDISKYKSAFKLHGHLDDVSSAYVNNDIIVIPSDFESFSMVTLESLSYGKTVVATDCGGPVEITSNGKFGYLFQSGNSIDLAQKIKQAIIEPKCPDFLMRRAGEFAIKNYCEKLEEIIK